MNFVFTVCLELRLETTPSVKGFVKYTKQTEKTSGDDLSSRCDRKFVQRQGRRKIPRLL